MNSAPNLQHLECHVPVDFLPMMKLAACDLESLDILLVQSKPAEQLIEVAQHFSSLTTLKITSMLMSPRDFSIRNERTCLLSSCKFQLAATNIRFLYLENILGVPHLAISIPQLKTLQIFNSSIYSLVILSDLESLDVINCEKLELLELLANCENLSHFKVVPRNESLRIKVPNPLLLDYFNI